MKLNNLALVTIMFIIISFILSAFDIISIELTEILAYSLLVIGIALVYTETIRQNRVSVFIGSIIFLFGIYFLITEHFNLNIGEDFYVPLILIFGGTGLLILFITTVTQKIFLYLALIFLSAGIAIIITNSHWGLKVFFLAFIPVLNSIWPILIFFLILIFLMRVR
jgi:hypothetical protein